MKKLLIFLVFIIFSSNVYADAKFAKDLKKVSKDSGFVDSKGTIYPIEQISNKENTILIIYTHGSDVQNLGINLLLLYVNYMIKKLRNFKLKSTIFVRV